MKIRILTSVSAALLLGGTALAQQPAEQPLTQGHLDSLDQNDSGAVNQEEYSQFMTNAFSQIDTDGDGFLAPADVSQILSSEQFTAMDDNGDGRVSRQEFMNQVAEDFATADQDGDGRLR